MMISNPVSLITFPGVSNFPIPLPLIIFISHISIPLLMTFFISHISTSLSQMMHVACHTTTLPWKPEEELVRNIMMMHVASQTTTLSRKPEEELVRLYYSTHYLLLLDLDSFIVAGRLFQRATKVRIRWRALDIKLLLLSGHRRGWQWHCSDG